MMSVLFELAWAIGFLFRMFFMAFFKKTILFTTESGYAAFKDEMIAFSHGSPSTRLTDVFSAPGGYQLRESPVGFQSEFHCTTSPQWCFILQGQMEIGLQNGNSKIFSAGEHFYSADVLPAGALFNPQVHGHCSRQLGALPLLTLFIKTQ